MLIMPRFKKSLIVEQFQGNYVFQVKYIMPGPIFNLPEDTTPAGFQIAILCLTGDQFCCMLRFFLLVVFSCLL